MNKTNVPLDILESQFDTLSPELKKAARYVMENPNEVSVSSVREIADAADVKPNTIVRMARQIGYEGYDDFREPFREVIRQGKASFPDRARWLQDMKKQGDMGEIYADMVHSTINNIEGTFNRISKNSLRRAAEDIWNAENVYTLGVGVNNSIATNFTYLASTGMVRFYAIPKAGSAATDDLAWAGEKDVLIAITNNPYRSEVIDAVRVAEKQNITIIAISDSPASPIIRAAKHGFIVDVDTPQFFPSSVATIAVLETLLSFVISSASSEIVERVEKFHKRRHQLGLYRGD